MEKKKKVLFIAKNIPIPNRQSGNAIIYTIAEKLRPFYDIRFFFPKSRVPWGLHFFKKYRPLYHLQDWNYHQLKVKVIPFTQWPGLLATYWSFRRSSKRAKSLFKDGAYELIHAHYGMPDGYLAYLLSKKFKVPYVLTIRNHDVLHLNQLKAWNPDYKKYHLVLENASQVLVSNANLQAYLLTLGVESTLMPHGIEAGKLIGEKSLCKDDIIRINCVANYIPSKNIEWVIDAVKSYSGERPIALQVIGDTATMPEAYQQLSDSRIKILGKMNNDKVLEELAYGAIFALPSQFETFGLVYLEAAATRNAIVGYKGQGVWGVFEDGVEMLYPGSYDEFKSQLYRLIEDDDLRQTLAAKAYAKAQTLTWEKVSARYQEVYSKAIAKESS